MKSILQIAIYGLGFYGLIVVAMYFFQEKMMFFPGGAGFGKCRAMEVSGARAVQADGVRYYLREQEGAEFWLVVFHGNAGNACDRTYFFNLFRDFKANMVVLEYPGYGDDPARPGEKAFCDGAVKLVSHLRKNDRDNRPVFLVGESIGTGAATWAATKGGVDGLILISAYTSLADVAQAHYFWLPVKMLMRHPFRADLWAGETDTPAILFHGVKDDIIPIKFARQQVNNFKGQAELVEIPNCGHNDIVDAGEGVIREKVGAFIKALGVVQGN